LRRDLAQRSTENLSVKELHQYLDRLQADLDVVHTALTRHYFHAYSDGDNPDKKSQTEIEFSK
jgi:uncharacterized alpha-E superfamily protein